VGQGEFRSRKSEVVRIYGIKKQKDNGQEKDYEERIGNERERGEP